MSDGTEVNKGDSAFIQSPQSPDFDKVLFYFISRYDVRLLSGGKQALSLSTTRYSVVIDVHVSTVTQCHSFAISVCNANWCCLAMGLVASLPPQARGTVCCEPRVHGVYHAGVSEHFLNVLLASCRGSRPSYWLPALLHKLVLRTANWMDQHVCHSVRCQYPLTYVRL